MTTPITGTPLADAVVQPPTTAPPAKELGKDTFLKLLVAQLKYQNPMAPQDGTQFLTQSAQFTMVEKLQELATQGAEMRTLASLGLVGRTVSYTDAEREPRTGVVDRVRQSPAGTVLVVGGKDVPLASVTEVSQTAAAAAAASSAQSTDARDSTTSS